MISYLPEPHLWTCVQTNLSRSSFCHEEHVFGSVQLLSHVQFFVTPWTAAHQASLSITSSQSLLKLVSIKSVMPSNHFILCCPLLLLPSIFPSIRGFSSESVLHIRWPKCWSFSFSLSSSSEYSGLISFRINKRLSIMQETRVRSLGREDPLENEMAIHSNTIAWKIPRTEEPGRLQSMGSQRVKHDWATSFSLWT